MFSPRCRNELGSSLNVVQFLDSIVTCHLRGHGVENGPVMAPKSISGLRLRMSTEYQSLYFQCSRDRILQLARQSSSSFSWGHVGLRYSRSARWTSGIGTPFHPVTAGLLGCCIKAKWGALERRAAAFGLPRVPDSYAPIQHRAYFLGESRQTIFKKTRTVGIS